MEEEYGSILIVKELRIWIDLFGMMCLIYQVILVLSFMALDGFCWNSGRYAVPCADCTV